MAILMRKICMVLIIAGWFYQSDCQNFDKQRSAFRTSYSQENSGDYQGAISSLRLEYEESSYEINLRLGWLCFKLGEFSQSEGYYRKAITLRPFGIEARLGLAFPLGSMGNWSLVNSVYEEILAIDEKNALANYRYGLLKYNKQDYTGADKLFSKVVNLYPFDYDSLLMLAWTRFRLGQSLEARALFQKALLYNPDDSSALEGLSLIH
jgi:tetratricopeptide (TPR) repeat protein